MDADADVPGRSAPVDAETGRAVIEAARTAAGAGVAATLAVVVATEGSTYVGAGAVALFADDRQAGWLSGGCLEPEIARRAAAARAAGELAWMDIDTRDDEDLLAGSALGCRGRLHLALLPLPALPGCADAFAAWLDDGGVLQLDLGADGTVELSAGGHTRRWRLPVAATADAAAGAAALRWRPSPALWLFGAGPETADLLGTLRGLGWRTTLVERRERWRALAAHADAHVAATADAALRSLLAMPAGSADAALVMHHHFELDREALAALAGSAIAYVGLLGPARRREDLFRVLPAATRDALSPRLRSPVGLRLGGHGAAAIALSIAAQLQAWRHGADKRG